MLISLIIAGAVSFATPFAGATPTPVRDGKIQESFSNGKPRVIREYANGAMVGEVVFTEAGWLSLKRGWDDGNLVSDDSFYANGSLLKSIRRSKRADGRVELTIQTFYDNGTRAAAGSALSNLFTDDGVPGGSFKAWSRKGVLTQFGDYAAGVKTGTWKSVLDKVSRTETYRGGRLERRIDIDPKTMKVLADDTYDQDGALQSPANISARHK